MGGGGGGGENERGQRMRGRGLDIFAESVSEKHEVGKIKINNFYLLVNFNSLLH